MGNLHSRILPHTNSQSIQGVHEFSHPGAVLPVQSTTLWPVHCTHGVHSGSQRGQTDGFTEGCGIHQYLDDWLVRATSHQTCLQHRQTLVALCRELCWLVNKKKSELVSKTGVQLRSLPVRPERGQGQTHTRSLASLNRQDSDNIVWSGVSGLAVHVPHRSTHSNRNAGPPRSAPYETLQWHLKNY